VGGIQPDGASIQQTPQHSFGAVLRKFIGERISVASRGVAGKAILMVQASQNRRRDHLGVFGEAMTGGHYLVRSGQRLGDPGSEAGVWTTAVIQLDNATPTILSLAKFATRGIRGSVGWSRCTKR
jgi:hypothetical protein